MSTTTQTQMTDYPLNKTVGNGGIYSGQSWNGGEG